MGLDIKVITIIFIIMFLVLYLSNKYANNITENMAVTPQALNT